MKSIKCGDKDEYSPIREEHFELLPLETDPNNNQDPHFILETSPDECVMFKASNIESQIGPNGGRLNNEYQLTT
jgi:hypothetical protein